MLVLYSDNSNVVAWLGTRRSPNPVVCSLVAAIECLKYQYTLKVSVRYIPSHKTRSADRLSPNKTPRWLPNRGSEPPVHEETGEIYTLRQFNYVLDNCCQSLNVTKPCKASQPSSEIMDAHR